MDARTKGAALLALSLAAGCGAKPKPAEVDADTKPAGADKAALLAALDELHTAVVDGCKAAFVDAAKQRLGPGSEACELVAQPSYWYTPSTDRRSLDELSQMVCDDAVRKLAAEEKHDRFYVEQGDTIKAEAAVKDLKRTYVVGVVYRNKSLPLVKSAKLDIAQSYSHGAESGVAYFYSLADGRIDCAAPVAFATSKKVEFSAKALSDKDEAQTAVDDDFKANGLKALEGAAKVKVEAGKAKAAAPLKAPHAAKASKHHHHSSSHHKKKHH